MKRRFQRMRGNMALVNLMLACFTIPTNSLGETSSQTDQSTTHLKSDSSNASPGSIWCLNGTSINTFQRWWGKSASVQCIFSICFSSFRCISELMQGLFFSVTSRSEGLHGSDYEVAAFSEWFSWQLVLNRVLGCAHHFNRSLSKIADDMLRRSTHSSILEIEWNWYMYVEMIQRIHGWIYRQAARHTGRQTNGIKQHIKK